MNEVEIVVTTRDQTDLNAIGASVKRRVSGVFGKVGEDSSSHFRRGFGQSFARGASSFFSGLAENATGIFGRAFGTATSSNPIIGAAIAAAVTAAVVVTLPAIGALAAGLFILGFGGAIAGLGLIFAAQNEKVKAAFSGTVTHITDKLKTISKPFEGVLINISKMISKTFDFFAPALEAAFARMAPAVERFFAAMMGGFRELAPVIGPVTDAFISLLDALGPALPGIVRGIANGIIAMANAIGDNPQVFVGLVALLGQIVAWGFQAIAWLTRVAAWFNSHKELVARAILDGDSKAWDRILEAALRKGSEFGKKVFRATLDGIGSAFSGEVNRAQGLGSRFARRVFTAAITGNMSLFQSVTNSAIRLGGSWARRKFTAALSATTNAVSSAVSAAARAGAGWARRLFKARLGLDIGAVLSGVSRAISAARGWAGRVFTAALRVSRPNIPGIPGFAHGGIVGAAGGGPRGGFVEVGEHGRELIQLPSGSRVRSNADTRRILSEGGSQRLLIEFDFRGAANDDLVKMIRNAIRVRGGKGDGNVQAVLG
jgi:hypothetical protein